MSRPFNENLRRDVSETIMQEQVIKQLVDLNYSNVETYPTFQFEPLSDEQKQQYLTQVITAVEKGVITHDIEIENRVREMLDLSPKEEEPEPQVEEEVKEEAEPEVDNEFLKTRIDTLNFSTRTANALNVANIRTVGGLVRKKAGDLLALDGLGEKGISEIKSILEEHDIILRD